MNARTGSGLAILLVVALFAAALDYVGRQSRPQHFVIPFQTGVEIASEAAGTIDVIAGEMLRQPDYVAVVEGHTGPRGDPEMNQALSLERAGRVAADLAQKGVSRDRIQTLGAGGAAPLPQQPDEGSRSYSRRLRRVEVTLTRQ